MDPFNLFKIPTKSALRGSLHPPIKIQTKLAVRGSLLFPFLKFGPNRRSVDPFAPLKNLDQIGGPWIPAFPFKINGLEGVEYTVLDLFYES